MQQNFCGRPPVTLIFDTISKAKTGRPWPQEVSVCGHSGCTTREMLDAAETEPVIAIGWEGCRVSAVLVP